MSLKELFKTFEEEIKLKVTPELEFQEKDAEGISLKGALQRARAKYLREKTSYKQGLSFSPSVITYNFCRRLKVAQLAGEVDLFYEKHPPRIQNNFDIGIALHEMVQGYFWDVGMLKGSFECLKCDKTYHDLISPTQCPSGFKSHTRKHMRYKEIKLKDEYFKISARSDGIAIVEDEEHIFDIKSIAARTVNTPDQRFCWEDLETQGPKDDHIIQLMFYMYLSEVHRGHMLYINKNDGKIRTFAIPYDYSLIEPYLQEIEDLLELARRYDKLKPGEMPPPCGRKDCPCEKF